MRPTSRPPARFTYLIARRQSADKCSASIAVLEGGGGPDVLGDRRWDLLRGFRVREASY